MQSGTGKSAGIALFYDESVEIKKIAVGPRYIDVLIRLSPNGLQWRGTFVYGEPRAHERHHMWELLRRIRHNASEPWLMIGDFNETMWQSEHFSRAKRSESHMADFRRVLADYNLHDTGFKGSKWTYNNKQSGSNNVKARLDRGVASPEWSKVFGDATIERIASSRSDHVPLLLRLGKRKEWRPKKKIFRYEAMWERLDSLSDIVSTTWRESGGEASLKGVASKLRTLQDVLSRWAQKEFDSVQRSISTLRSKLQKLRLLPSTPETETRP